MVTLARVPGAVSISKVSKTFASRGRRGPGRIEALASIDLEIEPGEAVTLLGPSGCGKTTLLRLIAGLENTSGGSITIDGLLPAETRSRKQIAFLPVDPLERVVVVADRLVSIALDDVENRLGRVTVVC